MPRGKDVAEKLKDEIILLNRLDRLSPKRIAARLNMSVNTVKTIVRMANKYDREGQVPKGRKQAHQDENYETKALINRLQMENELLRDFLRLAGRK